MGMFDYINVEIQCPDCGTLVGNFQSKDSDCSMDLIDPVEVSRFYSGCPSCNLWMEFSRIEETEERLHRKAPFSREEVEALGFKYVKRR